MNRRLFGAFGVLAVVALSVGGCTSDPLSDLDGNAAAVVTDFSVIEVTIGNSVPVTAMVLDGRATPIEAPITFSTCNGVVSIAPDTSYHPVPATSARVLVTGVTFGTSCVIAESQGLTDTVNVSTFPVALVVTGPDTLGSGGTATYSFQYVDAAGNPVAGVPAPTFASADTTRAKVVTGGPLGTFSGLAPGTVTISATGTGSPESGVTGTKEITVAPGAFLGTVSPTSGDPTDTIKLTNAAGGPGFDADTRVSINNVRAFTFGVTFDSVKVIVPGIGVAGPVSLGIVNMGAAQVAQNVTFTSNTASFADPGDPANDDATTAPLITANRDYYIVMSGACANGGGGAGTDCDDWFRIRNTGGSAATVTVQVDWFTAADVDVLMGTDPADVYAYGCEDSCTGATGANPQTTSLSIPAGSTRYVWVNLYDAGAAASSVVRVRVSGLP